MDDNLLRDNWPRTDDANNRAYAQSWSHTQGAGN